MKILGIRRGNIYSPNHIGNDAAIFNLTVDRLKELGYELETMNESDFLDVAIDAELIFSMVRDKSSIRKLQSLEKEGIKVINSGFGIENCTRERMTRLLLTNQVPHPKSLFVNTNEPLALIDLEQLGSHYWIKRGDFHAIHREDVTFARNVEEAETVLNEYAIRGIETAVLNEHLLGDLVKFYGVAGTDFFYWFYPNDLNHSKFGWEVINGEARGLPFDVNHVQQMCNQTAQVLGIDVYGGDCIVQESGEVKIIDFNDWPSFAPCRVEASKAIAARIHQKANESKQLYLTENKNHD